MHGSVSEKMNYLDASCDTVDKTFVQKELKATNSNQLVSRGIDTTGYNRKCGEILVGSHGKFTLICVFCTRSFKTLRSFGLHMHLEHIKMQIGSDIKDLPPRVNTPAVSTVEGGSHSPNNGQQVEIEFSHFSKCQQLPQIVEHEDDCGSCNEERKSDPNTQNQKTEKPKMTNRKVGQPTSSPAASTQSMTCKYCDNIFMDIITFGEHLSTHTGPKRFVCSFCPKTFDNRNVRQAHINTHTGERPHKCSYCPKAFAERCNLRMHERTHLGIKKYLCDYCDKRFVKANDKTMHERTHTGEKPFQCEQCGKRFPALYKLKEHSRRHQNIKNYKCTNCSMAFCTMNMLTSHMIVHTKERPFQCTVCGKSFPRKSALRNHQELHSNEKKYVCSICGKAFAQSAGLYTHKRSHKDIPL